MDRLWLNIGRKALNFNHGWHIEVNYLMFVFQAISPIICSMAPILYAIYCILFNGTAIETMIFMTIMIAWIPAVNSISTLFLVKQFRRRLIFWIKPSHVSSFVSSTIFSRA